MIRPFNPDSRRRRRWHARRQWHRRWVLVAVLRVENRGRVLVIFELLETRWSDSQRRRLWRVC